MKLLREIDLAKMAGGPGNLVLVSGRQILSLGGHASISLCGAPLYDTEQTMSVSPLTLPFSPLSPLSQSSLYFVWRPFLTRQIAEALKRP